VLLQVDGRESIVALRSPDVQYQLASLAMHPQATVASTTIDIVLSLVTNPEVAQEFSATPLMFNLASLLPRAVGDPASAFDREPQCAHLRLNILSAMHALLKLGQQHVATAAQYIPQLIHAARQDQPQVQLAACAVLGELLHAENVQTLSTALYSMYQVELLMPFGCLKQGGGESGGNSAARQEGTAWPATDLVWRLHSAIVPVLVQLLQVKEVCEAVPTILYPVICNELDLQRAVTDSNALECLASIIVAEVCFQLLRFFCEAYGFVAFFGSFLLLVQLPIHLTKQSR
jgi:hypothetical protein